MEVRISRITNHDNALFLNSRRIHHRRSLDSRFPSESKAMKHDPTSAQAILAAMRRGVYPTFMQDEVRALLILQDRDRRLITLGKDLEKLPQDEARAKMKAEVEVLEKAGA